MAEIGAEDQQDPTAAVWSGRRRFGIVSHWSTAMEDMRRVTVVARSHDTADGFLQVVWDTAREGVRDSLTALRKTVANVLTTGGEGMPAAPADAAVDDWTWRVARALFVWPLDAEPGGRDVLAAQDRLEDLLRGRHNPAEVFRLLSKPPRHGLGRPRPSTWRCSART